MPIQVKPTTAVRSLQHLAGRARWVRVTGLRCCSVAGICRVTVKGGCTGGPPRLLIFGLSAGVRFYDSSSVSRSFVIFRPMVGGVVSRLHFAVRLISCAGLLSLFSRGRFGEGVRRSWDHSSALFF